MNQLPHVTCVMPTTARRLKFIPRAIRCFLTQTHKDAALIIVSDGEGEAEIEAAIDQSVTGDERFEPSSRHVVAPRCTWKRVSHFHLSETPATMGDKYNACLELTHTISDARPFESGVAPSDLIALWADDDWHSPWRLETVLRAMRQEKADVGGTISMMAHNSQTAESFLYWTDARKPYLIGGTMIFPKRLWKARPFPSWKRASDTGFVMQMLWPDERRRIPCDACSGTRRKYEPGTLAGDLCPSCDGVGTQARGPAWVAVNDPRLYCAFVHGDNTGNPLDRPDEPKSSAWEKIDTDKIRLILGPDAGDFGL